MSAGREEGSWGHVSLFQNSKSQTLRLSYQALGDGQPESHQFHANRDGTESQRSAGSLVVDSWTLHTVGRLEQGSTSVRI